MGHRHRSKLEVSFLIVVTALTLWFMMSGRSNHAKLLTASIPAAKVSTQARLDKQGVDACNAFGFALLNELAKRNPNSNVVICPPSLSLMLSMAYNGAGSTTKAGIAKALHVDGMDVSRLNECNLALMQSLNTSGAVTITSHDSVWVDHKLECRRQFLEACKGYYQAEVWSINLGQPSSLVTINHWVSHKTSGRVGQILDEFDPDTVVVLVSAVCFDGAWAKEFGPLNRDVTLPFTLRDGRRTDVPSMGIRGPQPFAYQQCQFFQSVGIPYRNGRYVMYVFLPDRKLGLQGLLRSLSPDSWHRWIMGYRQTEIGMTLPLFEVRRNEGEALKASLCEMGMGEAFTPGADLSGMCSRGGYIGQVVHAVAMKVDKKGTQAAAATAGGGDLGEPSYPVLCIDRPFLYAVCDSKTGLLLFMGVIMNPARHT